MEVKGSVTGEQGERRKDPPVDTPVLQRRDLDEAAAEVDQQVEKHNG